MDGVTNAIHGLCPLFTGKGQSIWDRFTHVSGHIPNDATGDVASDSYHKYPEDVKCIERLGVCTYTISIWIDDKNTRKQFVLYCMEIVRS